MSPSIRPNDEYAGDGIWRHFALTDGLPDLKVECLYVADDGYLWVGTHDRGVVSYDGDHFTPYDKRQGLAGSGVFSVIQDASGVMYFATERGLSRLVDGKLEDVPGSTGTGLLWGACRDLEGTLWFGLERRPGRPAALFRCHGGRCELVELNADDMPEGESIHKIVCSPDGTLWVGGDELYRRAAGADFERMDRSPRAANAGSSVPPAATSDTIRDILVRPGGEVWVAALSEIRAYPGGAMIGRAADYGSPAVTLFTTKRQVTWVLTYGGRLCRYTNQGFELCRDLGRLGGGPICEDQSGCIWIGTFGSGLYCLDEGRVITHATEAGISAGVVAVASDQCAGTWVVSKRGATAWDGKSLSDIVVPEDLRHGELTAACQDRHGRLWVGTWHGLVYLLERVGASWHRLPFQAPRASRISSLAEGAEGRVWLAAPAAGILACWEDQGGEYRYSLEPVSFAVCAMHRDEEDRLWIGGNARGGVGRIAEIIKGRITPRLELGSGTSVRCLSSSADGRLWIGTGDGLLCWNGTELHRFGPQDGLHCTIVTALLVDCEGTVWVGTEGGGVARFDGRVFQRPELPGRPGFSVIRCIQQGTDGRIWLGTDAGLLRYAPRQRPPRVAIRAVVADRKHTASGVVRLGSGTRRVRFDLEGQGQGLLDRVVFRYRLYDHDSAWRQSEGRHVEYSELGVGSYNFVVQAVDCDLNYSSTADVKVVIAEDPWIELLATGPVTRRRDLPDRRARVLVVDPDEGFIANFRRLLSRLGHDAEISTSLSAARQRSTADSCDLVLLRTLGTFWETVRQIWALRGPHGGPDVLLLADHDTLAQAREAARLGASGYVLRAAEPQQFAESIDAALMVRWDSLARYLRENAGRLQGRDDVARRFDMSPGTVRNRVARSSGTSFTKFVQASRIDQALRRLVHTRMNIQQIAAEVGMSHAAFTRAFRQITQLTPLAFRREIRTPSV